MKKLLILGAAFICTLGASAQIVHVTDGGTWTITANEMIGTAYSTTRTATPGYFVGTGTANFTATSPDDAHVINGYQRHIATAVNQPYTFYVGSGTVGTGSTDLRTLAVSGTIPATSDLATAWIAGNPTTTADPTSANALHDTTKVGAGISKVSGKGQWDWVPLAGDHTGTVVTVSMPDMTGFAANASDLRLVGWDGTQWINLSTGTAPYATAITENSTLTGVIPTGITIQAIGIGTTQGLATVPDLTPRITATPNNVTTSGSTVTFIVRISEISDIITNGTDIIVYVDKNNLLKNFVYDPAATIVGTTPIQNSLFAVDFVTDPDYIIIKASGLAIKNTARQLSFTATFTPSATANGTANINAYLIAGSGGETNAANNTSPATIRYQIP